MKRALGLGLGLLLLVLALLAPAALFGGSTGGDGYEPTRITRYLADFDIDDQGDLRATEELTVDFPISGRHGIFRFWDRFDRSVLDARRVPREIRVTMDGEPVEVELSTEDNGRFDVAKIGSADILVTPGLHTYEISYRVDGVLEAEPGDMTSRFYWNLVPGG